MIFLYTSSHSRYLALYSGMTYPRMDGQSSGCNTPRPAKDSVVPLRRCCLVLRESFRRATPEKLIQNFFRQMCSAKKILKGDIFSPRILALIFRQWRSLWVGSVAPGSQGEATHRNRSPLSIPCPRPCCVNNWPLYVTREVLLWLKWQYLSQTCSVYYTPRVSIQMTVQP